MCHKHTIHYLPGVLFAEILGGLTVTALLHDITMHEAVRRMQ